MNSAAGKKILLVDDDDTLRESLAEQLRLLEEFQTEEAATGGEGLENGSRPALKEPSENRESRIRRARKTQIAWSRFTSASRIPETTRWGIC